MRLPVASAQGKKELPKKEKTGKKQNHKRKREQNTMSNTRCQNNKPCASRTSSSADLWMTPSCSVKKLRVK
jgi:hypothetical protein